MSKNKAYIETSTFKVPNMEICKWNRPICKFIQNLLQFQNKQIQNKQNE